MSTFNVWVTTTGDNGMWSTNGVDHESVDAAKAAGNDVWQRWFAMENWAVIESDMFEGHIPTQSVRIHAEFICIGD